MRRRVRAARVGQYLLVIWAAMTLNFALPHLAAGDPVFYRYAGDTSNLSPERLATLRRSYGLDRSTLEQYAGFWADAVQGDLGQSVVHNRPVVALLAEAVPWTLLLVGTGTVAAVGLGILAGAAAAWWRGSRRDAGLVVGVLAVDAMPGFWIGMLLISIFAVRLGWLPSFGAAPDGAEGLAWGAGLARHLVLPAATIALAGFGSMFLLTRAAMVATLDEPFVRLARAKGLSDRRIALRHALRNALLPVFTRAALSVGAILSGALVVETVFAYPGVGRLIYDAVIARDYPVLQGAFLLTTVGMVTANLLADLAYPRLDPRVRRH
ncbi:MAG: ABC transporter permease, partial [Acidimicrobiia bacterium]